jgi:hypothetical protein
VIEILETDGFLKRNSNYRDTIESITRTANDPEACGIIEARHGTRRINKSPRRPHNPPMPKEKAKESMKMIINEWLEEKYKP